MRSLQIQKFAQSQNSRLGNANASVRASLALRIFVQLRAEQGRRPEAV